MPKNRSEFGEIAISPLSGQLDLRSPSGRLGLGDFRLVLNASMNEMGKRCRRGGWKKLLSDSIHGFNNQDLHDQLVDGESNTNTGFPNCVDPGNCDCPSQTPACVEVEDFTEAMFDDCVAGAASVSPAWNGVIQGTSTCTWGFQFNQKSLNSRELAVFLAQKACPPEVNESRWVLTIMGRTDGATQAIIIWQGERSGNVVGTYHRATGCAALTTLALKNCTACEKPNVIIDPPDGTQVTTGTFVALHAPAGAVIYYTTDGGDPDDTSTLYDGPFPLPEGVTVIKAIAYSTDCVSDIAEAEYEVLENFLFQYLCQPGEDEAGVFFEFGPNGNSNDYKWRLNHTFEEVIDVKRLEIYETDSDGVWVTGQAWATDSPVYPMEMAGVPFSIYPLVIKSNGSNINTEYETTLLEDMSVGERNWYMYGQPFTALTGYFKLVFTYVDADGVEHKVVSLISNQCECYGDVGAGGDLYGDSYDDYYYCYDGEGGVISPVSSGIINITFEHTSSGKVGAAAVGNQGDYWNPFHFPRTPEEVNTSAIFSLLYANLDHSSITCTYAVEDGNPLTDILFEMEIDTSHFDEMMLYTARTRPLTVHAGVTIGGLVDGIYDVYVYGHGPDNTDILRCFLQTPFRTPPNSLRPAQSTAIGTGWQEPDWEEGQQYVVFRNVSWLNNEGKDMQILIPAQQLGGVTPYHISGIQIVRRS